MSEVRFTFRTIVTFIEALQVDTNTDVAVRWKGVGWGHYCEGGGEEGGGGWGLSVFLGLVKRFERTFMY